MKLTPFILRTSMELAEKMGAIKDAHMYNNNFISVDGTSGDGTKFSITVKVEEEEQDD